MDDLPAAVVRLRKKAHEAGWDVVTRAVYGDKVSIALRLTRDSEHLVAVWVNGRFDSGWQKWTPDPEVGGVSPRRLGARELAAVVTG